MKRELKKKYLIVSFEPTCGLTMEMIVAGVNFAYATLDLIDGKLMESGLSRLSGLVELANLSTIIGNLIAEAIVKAGKGVFGRAGAHKYQDLRSLSCDDDHVEIKVSLEKNPPKAHLAKVGNYLTFRYVLGNADGSLDGRARGDVVWIWEVRFGHLSVRHFNVSNTAGDSGKTAVVNKEGMQQLEVLYHDPSLEPRRRNYKPRSTPVAEG